MSIEYSRDFVKQFKKCQKPIQIAFRNRLAIFIANPYDARLRNHALIGKYLGYRSINITGDLRVVYEDREDGVYFVTLGTHSQLYK